MKSSRPSVDQSTRVRSKWALPSLKIKTGRFILLGLLALVPLPALAALGVSMSVAPTYSNPISQGDITAFKISITNTNNATAITGVDFTDNLPAQIKVAGAGLVSYTCTNGAGTGVATNGTVAAVVGSGAISLTNGTIPQAGTQAGACDIIVEVTSVTVGSFTNTIAAGTVTGNDGLAQSNSTPGAQSITVTGLNAPVISKSFSPTTIVKDLPTTLTIVISNANNTTKNLPLNGAGDTPAFAIQDNLPAGLAVATTPNASSVCSGAGVAPSFSPATGDTTLTVLGGTVAAGGTCTLKVDVVANTTSGNYSNILNNTINGTTQFGNTRGLTAGNATAALTVTAPLRVSKLFSPATVGAGQAANLTITLTNASPGAITLTTFTDDPIDGVGNAGYGLKINGTPTTTCPGSNVAATGGNTGITLTGGSISASSSCTITIPYIGTLQTPGTPQAFTNTITQGSVGTNDASIVSQPATHSVTVVDQLVVAKSVVTGTVSPGNPIRFSVTVSNYSGNPLTNVRIADTLPGGMVILPTTPAAPALSGTGCVGLTNDFSNTAAPKFTVGTVPAGVAPNAAACTVTFWAMLPANAVVGSNLDNIIQGGGVCDNNGAGTVCNFNPSNSTSARVTVNSVVTVSKVFNPTSASEGTTSQLTVTYTNLSAQPLTAASFTDNLPVGSTGLQLIVANPAVASSTCSGATITATPGSSVVSMSGATIPARTNNGTGANGTCVLKVNVIGAAGNYTNTLPAGALTATETYADGSTNPALASPGPVSASISYASALTTAKSFSPTVIQAGGKSTVTLRLGNVGSGTLNNVGAIDPLPTGMTVANPNGASTTCGGTPVITAAAGASSATITGATIPAGGQCDFIFDVKGTGNSNWVNTIPAGNITADGGVKNIAAVTATLTNNNGGALTITNNTSPNSLTAPGQVSVLSISITNNGALALDNLNLTDYFTSNGLIGGTQTGMQIANTPSASTTCSGGVVSAVTAGTSVSLSGASLAAGASCTVSVNVTLTNGITVQNIIPANAATTAQGVSNSLPTTTSLSAGSNIGVTKQFIPDVVVPGTRSRLRLTFINSQALPVTNLVSTDNLPAGVTVPASPNPTTTCVGATVSAPTNTQVQLTGGSLPAASNNVSTSCQAEIDVFVAAEGSYVNTIPAGGVTGDVGGNPSSNPVPATATLLARNTVTIVKAFAPNIVAPGVPSTLTITLTNPNTIALTAAALTDNFPANVAIAPTPNATTTCAGGVVTAAVSATKVSVAGATIPANGSCNVKVDVISNISGVYTNTIPAEGLTTSENITNANPTSDVLTVSIPPTIGKQFSPVAIPPNGTSTLTIVLNNNNASAITLTSNFDDVLPTSPGNIVIDGTPNVSKTCPGTVTANAGAAFVRYNNGGTIPAGGCTISVDVTGTTAGSYINTIATAALKTNVGNNPSPATATLLISTQGYISGRVFQDNNNIPNGTYESGTDSPLTNVLINLRDNTNAIIATTTTDALGNYAFTNLGAGTYSVEEPTQPPNTGNGITTAGTIVGTGTAGTATNLATTPSRISTIVLGTNAGQVGGSINNNFAEVVGDRTLSGRIFVDYDNNGQINGTDQGIGGITVNLTGTDVNSNPVSRSTTTVADGTYSFSGLPAGTYTVTEPTQPAGTSNGITSAGTTGGTATAVATLPSNISTIPLLGANTLSANNNFAEIPGASPDLTISKTHSPSSFADGGNSGYYTIVPGNIGSVATTGTITIVDTLPAGMTVAAPATGSGWTCTGSVGAAVVSCTSTASIPASGTGNAITLRVLVATGTNGQVLTNHAVISGGGEPPGFDGNNTAEDPTPISAAAGISGHVWLDYNHDRSLNSGDVVQGNWTVELLLNGVVVATTLTNTTTGAYSFTGLAPGPGYQVRFRHPVTGIIFGNAVPNETNAAYTSGTISTENPGGAQTTDGTLNSITLTPGNTIVEQSLPIDPAGVVYDAVTRAPVAGAVITITGPAGFNPAIHLVGGTDTQVTGVDGIYQFLLNPGAPNGDYTLTITTYPGGYLPQPSILIPSCSGALAVGAVPNPALVQTSNNPPATGATVQAPASCVASTAAFNAGNQATTQHYFTFSLTNTSAHVLNNHIPLDPVLGGALVITKTTPLVNVTKGDLVPYTVTATNTLGAALTSINIQDRIPPGFKYRTGSASINGVGIEPTVAGRDLTWVNQTFAAGERKTYKLMLIVGTGVSEGQYINQAWAQNSLVNTLVSNVASATVRVSPDPTFDCSDIIGKVFDDQNANGYQDEGEPGIPNVRVVTVRGLLVTTDPEGRFHVACADIPQADHGANFVMKLDERTLPSGYRLTTENPRDVRVTRGKMVKLNFGATVHRVVRLDLNGAAFAPNQTDLLPEWQQALEGMPDRLASRPSVLRIAYNPGSDDPALCKKRLEAVAKKMDKLWNDKRKGGGANAPLYPLVIETTVEAQQ